MSAVNNPPASRLPSYLDLLESNSLTQGERVFCMQRKGRRFYGDLLADGQIQYSRGMFHGRRVSQMEPEDRRVGRDVDAHLHAHRPRSIGDQ